MSVRVLACTLALGDFFHFYSDSILPPNISAVTDIISTCPYYCANDISGCEPTRTINVSATLSHPPSGQRENTADIVLYSLFALSLENASAIIGNLQFFL